MLRTSSSTIRTSLSERSLSSRRTRSTVLRQVEAQDRLVEQPLAGERPPDEASLAQARERLLLVLEILRLVDDDRHAVARVPGPGPLDQVETPHVLQVPAQQQA